jgi:hypothetical protein
MLGARYAASVIRIVRRHHRVSHMSKPNRTIQTVSIECASASVVADVEVWQYPDTAKDIDALDCKSDAKNFERLFRYLVARAARRHSTTVDVLYDLVAESELRRAVRKAVDHFRPEARSITCYASCWLRQALIHHIPRRPFTLIQPLATGGGR